MMVIGIVGGVASGKSVVAELFQQLGACRIDADRIGHQILNEFDVKSQVFSVWGETVFDLPDVTDGSDLANDMREGLSASRHDLENATINRGRLAKIVFGTHGEKDLTKLERITHPRIRRHIETSLADEAARCHAVVLDAPILLKAGWGDLCDEIVFVDCPRDIRLARAEKRGWDKAMFNRREQMQWSLDRKRACASCQVDGSADQAVLREEIAGLWAHWGVADS